MHNSQEVANTIKSLLKSKNITAGKMLADCNMNKNALFTMQSSGYLPRVEALAKIADYLDCSIDYLLGRTDVPEVNQRDNLIPIYTAARSQNGQYSRAGVEYVDQETLNRLRNAPETDEDF